VIVIKNAQEARELARECLTLLNGAIRGEYDDRVMPHIVRSIEQDPTCRTVTYTSQHYNRQLVAILKENGFIAEVRSEPRDGDYIVITW